MEKRSKHWADVLNWIQKVVDSCQTKEQVTICERLIRNFHKVYESQLGVKESWDLTREMERKLWDIGDLSFMERMKSLS